ncbi:MAG: transglycosylase family protein [Acidimicrobiales bacterium]
MATPNGSDDAPARAPLPAWWWEQTVRTRRIIAAAVLIGLVLMAGFVVSRLTGSSSVLSVAQAEIFVATLPPEQVERWDALAQCESGSDWSANTGNGYYGGLQIQESTWQGVGGFGLPHNTTREEQIMRAEDILELQGWNAWPNCSRQLGFG